MYEAEASRPPRFLDNPCARAPLFDPGGTAYPTTWCADLVFRYYHSVDSHNPVFRGSITRPARFLCTLRLAGHPTRRNTRFRVVVSLPGRGSLPLGCTEDFDVYIISLLSKLCLAHES